MWANQGSNQSSGELGQFSSDAPKDDLLFAVFVAALLGMGLVFLASELVLELREAPAVVGKSAQLPEVKEQAVSVRVTGEHTLLPSFQTRRQTQLL